MNRHRVQCSIFPASCNVTRQDFNSICWQNSAITANVKMSLSGMICAINNTRIHIRKCNTRSPSLGGAKI